MKTKRSNIFWPAFGILVLSTFGCFGGFSGCNGDSNGLNVNAAYWGFADYGNSRVIGVTNFTGTGFREFRGTGQSALNGPTDIVPVGDDFWVADSVNNRLLKLNLNFQFVLSCNNGTGVGTFSSPHKLSYRAPYLYFTDRDNHRIVRFNPTTLTDFSAYGSQGNGQHQFNQPVGLAFDQMSRMYISDRFNHRIVRVDDFTGAGWTAVGSMGNGTRQFNDPRGISWDGVDCVVVADSLNHRIAWFDFDNPNTWDEFGGLGSGVGQFNEPSDVKWVSQFSRYYVADSGNNRIAWFDQTKSGWNTYGSFGSGAHQFDFPFSVSYKP